MIIIANIVVVVVVIVIVIVIVGLKQTLKRYGEGLYVGNIVGYNCNWPETSCLHVPTMAFA